MKFHNQLTASTAYLYQISLFFLVNIFKNSDILEYNNIRMFGLSNSENFTALMMILLIMKCISMIADNKLSAYSEIRHGHRVPTLGGQVGGQA